MAYEHIRVDRDGGIITITLNRPETRNSMTPAMGEELVRAVEEIKGDLGRPRVTLRTAMLAV